MTPDSTHPGLNRTQLDQAYDRLEAKLAAFAAIRELDQPGTAHLVALREPMQLLPVEVK